MHALILCALLAQKPNLHHLADELRSLADTLRHCDNPRGERLERIADALDRHWEKEHPNMPGKRYNYQDGNHRVRIVPRKAPRSSGAVEVETPQGEHWLSDPTRLKPLPQKSTKPRKAKKAASRQRSQRTGRKTGKKAKHAGR